VAAKKKAAAAAVVEPEPVEEVEVAEAAVEA
jgi:hypothetical protein